MELLGPLWEFVSKNKKGVERKSALTSLSGGKAFEVVHESVFDSKKAVESALKIVKLQPEDVKQLRCGLGIISNTMFVFLQSRVNSLVFRSG